MTPPLAACPFCGEPGVHREHYETRNWYGCPPCDVGFPTAAEWNNRWSPAPETLWRGWGRFKSGTDSLAMTGSGKPLLSNTSAGTDFFEVELVLLDETTRLREQLRLALLAREAWKMCAPSQGTHAREADAALVASGVKL